MKIAIVHATFNADIGENLLKGALRYFDSIDEKDVDVFAVPGALELAPFIDHLIQQEKYIGFIALGAVIKGETYHFESVNSGTTYGLQKVAIEGGVPVMNGVLMCYEKEQAIARSGDGENNKGYECAKGLHTLITQYEKVSTSH